MGIMLFDDSISGMPVIGVPLYLEMSRLGRHTTTDHAKAHQTVDAQLYTMMHIFTQFRKHMLLNLVRIHNNQRILSSPKDAIIALALLGSFIAERWLNLPSKQSVDLFFRYL